MDISVHPLTKDPNDAWDEISKTQSVIDVDMEPPELAVDSNKARIVCMSDTHSLTQYITFEIPDGDIFIHAGDFTRNGRNQEVVAFNNWIGTLPHKHKIVIAGNHELSFDVRPTDIPQNSANYGRTKKDKENIAKPNVRDLLTNCTYIEDKLVEIWGIRIYGSPWQPEYFQWAFNLPRGLPLLEKWNRIPADIDILVTHTPPLGHGDLCRFGQRAGCVELLATVQKRVKPKYHVFGHIHEGYGVTSDGSIIYVNASTCNVKYSPVNPPIVFDLTLPENVRKGE